MLAQETVLFERRRSEFGRFQPTERKFFERSGRSIELFAYFLFQDKKEVGVLGGAVVNH
jgi:hypothetical protein